MISPSLDPRGWVVFLTVPWMWVYPGSRFSDLSSLFSASLLPTFVDDIRLNGSASTCTLLTVFLRFKNAQQTAKTACLQTENINDDKTERSVFILRLPILTCFQLIHLGYLFSIRFFHSSSQGPQIPYWFLWPWRNISSKRVEKDKRQQQKDLERVCISTIRQYITEEETKTLVTWCIVPRNPSSMAFHSVIQPLRRVQKSAARLIWKSTALRISSSWISLAPGWVAHQIQSCALSLFQNNDRLCWDLSELLYVYTPSRTVRSAFGARSFNGK